MRLDEQTRGDFPILAADRQRPPARVPRLGGLEPEAARGLEAMAAVLRRRATPTSTARSTRWARRRPSCTSWRATASSASSARPAARKSSSPAAPRTGSTWSPRPSAGRSGRATRSSSPTWSTTRTSSRGRWRPGTAARRCGRSRSRGDGAARSRGLRAAADAAHAGGRVRPRVERARARSRPWPRSCRAGARGRARSRSSTGLRRRLTCRSICPRWDVTFTCSRLTRCSGRPASASCAAGARCWTLSSPTRGGGEMIKEVWIDRAQWNDLPWRFEPGTPPIAEAVGLMAAIEYLEKLGMERVAEHERALARAGRRAARRASPA